MNKEKLKELLDSDVIALIGEYMNGDDEWNTLIEKKRKELKEPVYKTEDGYEVKEGDVVYAVNIIQRAVLKNYYFIDNKNKTIFKLKENAENYLCFMSESLSINDVICELSSDLTYHKTTIESILKKKVKTKLGV
jgi:hypothetical protein